MSDEQKRNWRLMQRVELCRYRAELAEALASVGSHADSHAMMRLAAHWRSCADHLQLLHRTPVGAAGPIERSACAKRAEGKRRGGTRRVGRDIIAAD